MATLTNILSGVRIFQLALTPTPFINRFFPPFTLQITEVTKLSPFNILTTFLFSAHHWESRWTTRQAITGQLNHNEVRNFVKGGKDLNWLVRRGTAGCCVSDNHQSVAQAIIKLCPFQREKSEMTWQTFSFPLPLPLENGRILDTCC